MFTDTQSPRTLDIKQIVALMAASLYQKPRYDDVPEPEEKAREERQAMLCATHTATQLYNLTVDVTGPFKEQGK